MPYIKDDDRVRLNEILDVLEEHLIRNPGELNYLLTQVCLSYFEAINKPGYNTINNVVGALECTKLEFYRRLAAPYEDTKIEENGDVYNV